MLDTHVLIWYFDSPDNIPPSIVAIIDNPLYIKSVSVVSLWEIAIKMSIGKLKMSLSFDELWNTVSKSELNLLPIKGEHIKNILQMPSWHKDPFDRMIVASAINDELTIITVDENVRKYNISWIW